MNQFSTELHLLADELWERAKQHKDRHVKDYLKHLSSNIHYLAENKHNSFHPDYDPNCEECAFHRRHP